MSSISARAEAVARGGLDSMDRWLNRLYGHRMNPFYHSGSLVILLLLVLFATGIYLLLFYRTGAPYASMERITDQAWTGRWIRSLHRFASAASVVAIAVHAVRMFAQGRSWGPRTLAWVSGVGLLLLYMLIGWTGYVMVWDVQAQVLAVEGARIIDALPILSEPLGRTFTGETAVPSAFFFMNLFLHVALPIGLGLLLWLHVTRSRRPVLLPPRALSYAVVGLLMLASVLWPIRMAPEADLLRAPAQGPYDFFYAFWLPVTQAMTPGLVWLIGGALVTAFILVPLWTRPRPEARPAPSVVDERLCTGCEQCSIDCPYEAISMVERTDGRPTMVARVDASLCVSCGICAGSCAPMVVGPPGRSGRDQIAEVRRFITERRPSPRDVVVIACHNGAGGLASLETFDGSPILPVRCAGSIHSSVIEFLVRSGAGGVMVVSCPVDDCWNREGALWLEARVNQGREAELQERVDRRRVRLVEAAGAERGHVAAALREFRETLVEPATLEEEIDLIAMCERAEEEVVR